MLKPVSFKTHIIYQCPLCDDKHWYSTEEVKYNVILQCCGQTFHIQPINKVFLECKFKQGIPKKVISILKTYGFTEEQIKSSSTQGGTTEEFVRNFLVDIK